MTHQEPPNAGNTSSDTPATEPEWKRKRRLAAIFGDVLPTTTDDERGPDGSAPRDASAAESAQDAWLKAQVPPHHGNV